MIRYLASVGIVLLVWIVAYTPGAAEDRDGYRPYFTLRFGGGGYTNPDSIPGIELENPGQYPVPQFAFGANFDKHWGAELMVNYTETNVAAPGITPRLGEYATWMVMPQVRFRYPMYNDMIVPYIVAGAGIGIGGFNDRNVAGPTPNFSGGQDTSFIGGIGAGIDYFFNRNTAITIEAKQILGFETDVVVDGQPFQLDSSQLVIQGGLRIFFDTLAAADGAPPKPKDRSGFRPYVAFRTGGAFFTNPDALSSLEITNPTKSELGGSVGVNFDKHWGAEISGDYWETTLEAPGIGKVSEYALWDITAQARYRYPLMNDRLVPYALAGGGIGFTEVNDRAVPTSTFDFGGDTDITFIGVAGGGIEYFVEENVAVGFEARYLFGFDSKVNIGTQSATLDNNTILFQVGLRIFLP